MRLLSLFLILILVSCVHQRDEAGAIFLQKREGEVPLVQERPVVVIDAGHGGTDEGCSHDGCEEKELALNTAHLVQKHLHQMGYTALLTRSNDIFVSLDERAALANDMGANLFVSIHFNHALNKKAKGIEVYYFDDKESLRSKESKALAESVLAKVVHFTEGKSRGVKNAGFRVIKKTEMPAILVEGGFLSNAEEKSRCKDPLYQEALAWGISRGVDLYLKSNF